VIHVSTPFYLFIWRHKIQKLIAESKGEKMSGFPTSTDAEHLAESPHERSSASIDEGNSFFKISPF
jgi:hypothetical protein